MSYKVAHEVREHSRARHGTLHVLDAIADVAHHDGVGWLPIEAPTDRPGDKKNLAFQARLSARQVRRAIERLAVELDELEVRIGRRHRVRFYVYRVIVGRIRDLEVDYERGLPELDAPFWTPDELLLHRVERRPDAKLTTGHFGRSSEASDGGDDRTSATATSGHLDPRRADICDTPTRAREKERSLGPVPGTVLDDLTSSKPDRAGDAPARPAPPGRKELIDALIRAFAEELGGWPKDRNEWGAWAKAFAPLVDEGVDAEQLGRQTRRYRTWLLERAVAAQQTQLATVDFHERRERVEIDLTPFGLTRHWQMIEASLASSYFALHRWVTATSWRFEDAEDAAWVLDSAPSLTDAERAQLHRLAADVRAAHADPDSELLRWVESPGAFLSDEDWCAHFDELQVDPDLRRRANELRLEIRSGLAQLRFDERGAA